MKRLAVLSFTIATLIALIAPTTRRSLLSRQPRSGGRAGPVCSIPMGHRGDKHLASRRLQCMAPNLLTLPRKTRGAVRRRSFLAFECPAPSL